MTVSLIAAVMIIGQAEVQAKLDNEFFELGQLRQSFPWPEFDPNVKWGEGPISTWLTTTWSSEQFFPIGRTNERILWMTLIENPDQKSGWISCTRYENGELKTVWIFPTVRKPERPPNSSKDGALTGTIPALLARSGAQLDLIGSISPEVRKSLEQVQEYAYYYYSGSPAPNGYQGIVLTDGQMIQDEEIWDFANKVPYTIGKLEREQIAKQRKAKRKLTTAD